MGFFDVVERMKSVIKKSPDIRKDSDAALARALGVTPQSFGYYKKVQNFPSDKIVEFSKKFGISLDWVVYGESGNPDRVERTDFYRIPIISWMPAGDPVEVQNETGSMVAEWVPVSSATYPDGCYAVRVKGHCMAPEIEEGDIVICKFAETAPNNKVVICRNEYGEHEIKRFKRSDDGKILLCSDNEELISEHPKKKKYPDKEPNGWKIVGIALRRIKDNPIK